MSDRPSHNLSRLDINLASRIDEVCRQFEADWREGRRPRIEDYLMDVSHEGRPALRSELEALERELRQSEETMPRPEAGSATTHELLPAPPPSAVAEAPTITPGMPPTSPLPGAATTDTHDVTPPRDEATVDHVWADSAQPDAAADRVRYFGDYELIREIARGGMGVVFFARQMSLNRPVALKMILAGQLASETDVKRFHAEAEAAAKLDHPGIVPIYEVGQHEGQHYFSMGFIQGRSLSQRLTEGPLAPREAAELIRRVCEAIDYAHQHGVIHRDLKPANILLDGNGNPRVTDFGLAKKLEDESGLTGSGQIMGTLSYMPPEQAGGKRGKVGPAADVYALGATLYALLTGRPPFHAATPMDTLIQAISAEVVPPRRLNASIPVDLETICLKCLEKEPGRRYAGGAALGDDLLRFLENRPIKVRRSSSFERFRRWCRRNPAVAALSGLTLTLLLTLTVVSSTAALRINRDRQRADRTAADEKAAREKADDATVAAQRARHHAQERLVRLNIVTGNFLTDARDYGSALLRYSQAWMLDRDDPSAEPMHRLRLACLLERYPRLEGICFHTSPVLQACFDGSGGRVLTRTEDGRAFLWDPYRSRSIASPLPHNGKVLCVALSRDGARAVTAGIDGTARMWAATNGKPLGAPLQHPGAVPSAAFSPDGERLATACNDGTVRFWTVPGGKPLEPTVRLSSEVRFVGFSPDGRRLVTVDGRRTARVWDTANGQPLTPSLPHQHRDLGVHLTPVSQWDRLFQPPLFSPDSARLLTADEETTVRLNDARTGELARPPRTVGFVLNRAAFSSDGGRILLVGKSSESYLWDAVSDREILTLDHPREVQAGCLSADGRWVATSSSMGLIHLRDAQTGKYVVSPFRHVANLTELAFTPEGYRLVAASLDGTVRIWDVGIEPFQPLPYDYSCGRADHLVVAGRCLSPDGSWEVRADDTTGATLRRRTGGEPGPHLPHPGRVRKALFAPNARSVLTADDERCRVWDAGTGRPRGPLLPVSGGLKWAHFSDDGSSLLLVDDAGTLSVHATTTGSMVLGPITLDVEFGVHALVALGPDGRRLAVHFPNPYPGETRVYQVDSGRILAIPVPNGNLASVAFSPDGRRLLTAASDTLARVWDAETGEPVGPPMRHPSFVRLARFAPDGRLVVTLDANHVRLWDSATGDLLTPPLPHRLGRLADVWVSRDGRRIVALAPDGTAQQWELPTLRTATDRVLSLVQLLTGQQVDASDGIAPLESSVFRDAPEEYRLAWMSGRQGDFPAVTSFAGSEKEAGKKSNWYSRREPGFTDSVREARASADREIALGHTQVAVWHLVTLSAADPDDTILALRVGALQAWFGQDKELADTCRRALDFAKGTSDPPVAERMAKICCLRPTQDTSRLESSLALARKAVDLGKNHGGLAWFQMTLGMAEYRAGHFLQADAALLAAANGDKDNSHVVGTSAFYRAMSLFRQGKEKEARQLAIEAASAIIKPLPKDEKNPLADDAGHDDLIVWLAYKEAQALIEFDPAPTSGK